MRVCIVCNTNIPNDPRVMRQIDAFARDDEVVVVGKGQLERPGVTVVGWDACYRYASGPLERFWYFLCFVLRWYRILEKRFSVPDSGVLRERKFDVVLVNEVAGLPLGALIARGAPLVCDLHEYYFDDDEATFIRSLAVRYYRWLCGKYLPLCRGVTTVSDGLASMYHDLVGVRPTIVLNAPPYVRIPISRNQEGRIRLIHHGYADPRRNLERMIEMMDHVDSRFTLDLMLTTDSPYRERLRRMAAENPKVHWREPVPMHMIAETINEYDMGVYILPPLLLNTKYSLPNKLFEFIQARLGVAIGPSVEMVPFVRDNGLGVVADDFEPRTLAAALNVLTTEDVAGFKRNAEVAAGKYNADASMQVMKEVVRMAAAEGGGRGV